MNAEQAETLSDVMGENREGSGGDYADVWKPQDGDRDTIIGDVVDMRKNPFGSPEEGSDDQYALVLDTPKGELQTPTHTILNNILLKIINDQDRSIDNGDVFQIYYLGKIDTDGPRKANNYEISHLKAAEFDALMSMDGDDEEAGDDNTEEAQDFLESLIGFKSTMTTGQIDQMLNEERELGVDAEEVAEAIGLTSKETTNDDGEAVTEWSK